MADNLTEEQADEQAIKDMEASLKDLKKQQAQKKADKREALRIRQWEERDARVAEYRRLAVDEFVGPSDEWVAISIDYKGSLEMTVHEETTPQFGFVLSSDDAKKLRDILNARLG